MVGTLVVAAVGGATAMADATTALFLSREELVRVSDIVARVKVGKTLTAESDDKAAIITRTDVEVTQCLKGNCSTHVVVQQFGGTYNGKTQRILGDAKLVPGEDAVVFLKRGGGGVTHFSVLAQSAYHVDNKGMARRSLDGLTLVKRTGSRMVPIVVTELPETVESLMTDVKRLAGGK